MNIVQTKRSVAGGISLLLLFLTGFVTVSKAQKSADISISPQAINTRIGQTFTVDVALNFTSPGASMNSSEVHLAFDHTKLMITAISTPSKAVLNAGPFVRESLEQINKVGQVNYLAGIYNRQISSNVKLLTITFAVLDGAGESLDLTLLSLFPANTNVIDRGVSILRSLHNATVVIENKEQQATDVKENRLDQNYPNPSGGQQTQIKYTLIKNGDIDLSLFDLNGKKIKTIQTGTQQAGEHTVLFHTNAIPAGVYYYKLTTDGFTGVRKLVVQR